MRAVVAVAPFSDMRSEVSHYVRTIGMPGVGPFLSEEYIQAAVDEAGRINGFSPDRADAAIAIQYTDAPVLLVHGKADMIIPCATASVYTQPRPITAELMLMPGLGHVTVWFDPLGKIERGERGRGSNGILLGVTRLDDSGATKRRRSVTIVASDVRRR